MSEKKFHLSPEEIKPLIEEAGSCIASDRITVDGAPVGYMYREAPTNDMDSGWRFFAGDEDDAYADDPDNFGIFSVNTIVNYDASITPFLDTYIGIAFERDAQGGGFVETESPVDPDDCLHPDYPVVEGDYGLSEAWRIQLPAKFNRRIEEGALVLWRPGMTLYFVAWNNDLNDTIETRVNLLQADLNPKAFDPQSDEGEGYQSFTYRLTEEDVNQLYGFVVTDDGHLQVAISFDDEDDLDRVRAMFASIRY